jgi:hypothetical protein
MTTAKRCDVMVLAHTNRLHSSMLFVLLALSAYTVNSSLCWHQLAQDVMERTQWSTYVRNIVLRSTKY